MVLVPGTIVNQLQSNVLTTCQESVYQAQRQEKVGLISTYRGYRWGESYLYSTEEEEQKHSSKYDNQKDNKSFFTSTVQTVKEFERKRETTNVITID